MGNTETDYNYSKPMEKPSKKGESRIYRHPLSMDKLLDSPNPNIKTL